MKQCFKFAFCAGVFYCAFVFGQTTQPANLPLEDRANQAYNQGQYVKALPLLEALAGTLIDSPEKLSPIEERIRACKAAIKSMQATHPTSQPLVAQPGKLATTRSIHIAPQPGQVLDISINDLGNFDYDNNRGGDIPKDVLQLSGCTLRTRGYMIPLDQADDIREFALVTSIMGDGSRKPPQVRQTIIVHLPPDKAIHYFPDLLQVEGKLTVQEKKDQGYILSIFDIDATSIKPAPKQP
jgi:hypothetical protein